MRREDKIQERELNNKIFNLTLKMNRNEATEDEVARTAGMPEFTYGEILLKSSAAHVNLMQPLPMQVEVSLVIKEG